MRSSGAGSIGICVAVFVAACPKPYQPYCYERALSFAKQPRNYQRSHLVELGLDDQLCIAALYHNGEPRDDSFAEILADQPRMKEQWVNRLRTEENEVLIELLGYILRTMEMNADGVADRTDLLALLRAKEGKESSPILRRRTEEWIRQIASLPVDNQKDAR